MGEERARSAARGAASAGANPAASGRPRLAPEPVERAADGASGSTAAARRSAQRPFSEASLRQAHQGQLPPAAPTAPQARDRATASGEPVSWFPELPPREGAERSTLQRAAATAPDRWPELPLDAPVRHAPSGDAAADDEVSRGRRLQQEQAEA
jgi:hypothetical protein